MFKTKVQKRLKNCSLEVFVPIHCFENCSQMCVEVPIATQGALAIICKAR